MCGKDGVTDRAMRAFGQAGCSTGGFHRRIGDRCVAEGINALRIAVRTAGAGEGFHTGSSTGGFGCDNTAVIAVTQSGNCSLCGKDGVTDRAVRAFRQTGGGTCGGNCRIGDRCMTRCCDSDSFRRGFRSAGCVREKLTAGAGPIGFVACFGTGGGLRCDSSAGMGVRSSLLQIQVELIRSGRCRAVAAEARISVGTDGRQIITQTEVTGLASVVCCFECKGRSGRVKCQSPCGRGAGAAIDRITCCGIENIRTAVGERHGGVIGCIPNDGIIADGDGRGHRIRCADISVCGFRKQVTAVLLLL